MGVTAEAAGSCRLQFTAEPKSFALPERGVFTAEDRAELARILSSGSGFTAKAAWDQIFNAYVERRLSTVPVHERAPLRAKILSFKVQYNTVHHFLATSEGVNLPREFEGTPIPAIIRAHETEHLIQMYQRNPGDSPLRKMLFYKRTEYDPFLLRNLERDAMLAEWELLSVLPENAMRDARMVVHRSNIDFEYKFFLVKMLSNYRLTREQHLADQYGINRYTMNAIAKNAALRWLGTTFNISVFCGSSYLLSWLF